MPPVTIVVPDAPIVTFDPDAMRTWLTTPIVTFGYTPADDARIGVDAPYDDNCLPGDWLKYLLLRMRHNTPPCPAWTVPASAAVEAHATTDAEGPDGGAVIIVDLGGVARIAVGTFTRHELVSTQWWIDDEPAKTQLDAAVEAFKAAADAINDTFAALTR